MTHWSPKSQATQDKLSEMRKKSRKKYLAGPGYSNTAEVQDNNLKFNFMKMIKALKEEINKSLK